ncbi:MAG: hypothetical protein ACYTHM_12960, partial [Planctomycetota bacterium]
MLALPLRGKIIRALVGSGVLFPSGRREVCLKKSLFVNLATDYRFSIIGGDSVTPEEIKEKVIEIVCEQMGVDREKVTP